MSQQAFRDEEILTNAQARGPLATTFAFMRLSGPGWLQAAITLGGGSLGGALYLGMMSGTSMLWLQVVAMLVGLVMLMAIAYVTVTSGVRPYAAINEHINPVLGVGWLLATILANMIFILGQFSLCYTAVNDSLFPNLANHVGSADPKLVVTLVVAAVAMLLTLLSFRPGATFRIVDFLLKLIVGLVVLCFVGVVVALGMQGELNWPEIVQGYLPNFLQWNNPSESLQTMLGTMDGSVREFYEGELLKNQRKVMIGVTATAVGLNMTFLLPYSLIQRGWNKPTFRGITRVELIVATAIPFILVTSCIVIASAHAFHAKADTNFLSKNAAEVQQSPLFKGAASVLEKRYVSVNEGNEEALALIKIDTAEDATEEAKKEAIADKQQVIAEFAAGLSEEERKLSLSLVRPNAGQLATTLEPVLMKLSPGTPNAAKLVFGIGALAMGFSTIYILMLINGYAFAEMFGNFESIPYRFIGALLALAMGVSWIWIWGTQSATWLLVITSTFAGILLPIAYIAFFLLMNSRDVMGDFKPTGARMSIWNILMLVAVVGAIAQSCGGVYNVVTDGKYADAAPYIIGGLGTFLVLAVIGFSAKLRR